MPSRELVHIANPDALHGKRNTTRKNAERLVRQERAAFMEDGTLFVASGLPNAKADTAEGYEWHAADSGGSSLVKAGAGKVAGGYRVMQAERGRRKA